MPSNPPPVINRKRPRLLCVAFMVLFAAQSVSMACAQSPMGPPPDDTVPLPTDPATVMAGVGQSPILWGDIQPKVEAKINEVLEQQQVQFTDEQLQPARKNLARGALRQAIQTKMMSESSLLSQVGTQSAEKRAEVSEMMTSRARQMFFENELKGLKEKYETEDLNELNEKLSETGSSLHARQRDFTDMMLGHMYMKSKVEKDPHVTIAEVNQRYAKNIDSYRHNAKARWEQLSALYENHPDAAATEAAITAMGREAYFGGNLQKVAREKSEEPYAADGGVHDWTAKGSLKSVEIEEQLFTIPLNRMSEIIKDETGLHIIRVLERKPAGVQPLADLQDDIREELKNEKILASQQRMVEEMQRNVPVWSMYPTDTPGAKPLGAARIATSPDPNSNLR